MKIIALVKQVPDTGGERKLDASGLLDRDASERIIDEINERSLEVALSYKDTNKQTEVVLVSMGPADATSTLRKGLSMGADSAIHIVDDSLAGSDAVRTSAVLAAALKDTGFDLVVAGNESTDGRGGVVPAMLAERLGVAQLTHLNSVELSEGSVSGIRSTDNGTLTAHAQLPAVISITEIAAEPRFPNFKGIMTAKKKPVTVLSLADLGVETAAAQSVVVSATARPARAAGKKVIDDGNAATELAEFLAAERLI
ncbi:MAG: electron transfer flavoprotein subunit beta/FixA family protein [Homoserinimonas sp.]